MQISFNFHAPFRFDPARTDAVLLKTFRSLGEPAQMYEFFFKLTPNNAGSILIFRNLLPKFVFATARKGGVIAFSEYVVYLCNNILTDTESVSLFSTCERRKFTGRENKRNLLHVLSMICGSAWGCCLFIYKGFLRPASLK